VLLARVAESMYWSARYLERAENTARIVREHTNLIMDFPSSEVLTWQPLSAVAGSPVGADQPHSEHDVVTSLVADSDNAASIAFCVGRTRENLRTCREVIPQEYWLTINDLFLYVASRADEGVDRRSRSRFLTHIINESQRAVGILGGVMSSDHAYEMLRLGRTIERADMTTRVLDVQAVALLDTGQGQLADVQWAAVLRSLSALQMFHRARPEPIEAMPVVEFLLHDPDFPRSVRCCLDKTAQSINRLPFAERLRPTCEAAIDRLETGSRDLLAPNILRQEIDAVQLLIGDLSDRLSAAYFRPA
jgi:uncharacterized alpha-E superfamily protein